MAFVLLSSKHLTEKCYTMYVNAYLCKGIFKRRAFKFASETIMHLAAFLPMLLLPFCCGASSHQNGLKAVDQQMGSWEEFGRKTGAEKEAFTGFHAEEMQKAGKILRQLRQNLIKVMQMERQNRRTEQLGLDRLMPFEEEKEVKNGLEENDCDDEGRGEQEQQHGEEGKGPAVADEIFVAEEEQRTGEQSAADEGKEKDELFAEAPGIAELNREIAPLLYQGDMVLTVQQASHLLRRTQLAHRRLRFRRQAKSATRFPTSLWPDRQVPYSFHPSITQRGRQVVGQALDFWAANTCLNFVEENDDNQSSKTKLQFVHGGGCYSNVGRIPEQDNQPVSIGEGCEHFGIASHEVAHALGFFHTQSRWDRDQFVTLNWENIAAGYEEQFDKEPPEDNDNQAIPYDLGSVMHYAQTAFSISESKPVLIAHEPHNRNTMGQRTAPSFLDVQLMNKRYGCLADCEAQGSGTAQCQHGGFPRPKDCASCICPWGFGGQLCKERHPGNGPNKGGLCGRTLEAKAQWQQLKGAVGERRNVLRAQPWACHWHIQAPEGKEVELRVTGLGGVCSKGCFFSNVELKVRRDMTKTGIRICCPADVPEEQDGLLLRSEGSLAVVSLYTRQGVQSVELDYRFV